MEMNGKIALVTGASSGLGAEFAKQLHSKGAGLILVARRANKLQDLADKFNKIRPESAMIICADLTERNDLDKVVEYIKKNRVDILINNAGFGSLGYFEEIDIKHETKMISLNISSTLETLHAALPQMKDRKDGAIVSLSSVAAFQPMPFMSTYAATKVFNFFHTMAVRSELAAFNVKVLTVCPGPTDTEFFGAAHLSGMAKTMKRDKVEDVVRQSLAALDANKPYVVTGLLSKLTVLLTSILPYTLSSWVIKKVLAPK